MVKNKSLLLPLLLITNLIGPINAAPRLTHFAFGSASVLPVIMHNNEKCVILSREAFGGARGTYDDFGGSRDKGERHPVVTAAREFYEEAILQKTIGLNVQQVQNYIDISKTNNTKYIVGYSQGRVKNVTYITHFDQHKTEFFNNFYPARRRATDHHLREKDRIAIVKWQVLTKTFAKSRNTRNVKIEALVMNPITQKWYKSYVTLRAFFIKKLRPFFLDRPYEPGMDPKIRFYNE